MRPLRLCARVCARESGHALARACGRVCACAERAGGSLAVGAIDGVRKRVCARGWRLLARVQQWVGGLVSGRLSGWVGEWAGPFALYP